MSRHLGGLSRMGGQSVRMDPGLTHESFEFGGNFKPSPGPTVSEVGNAGFPTLTRSTHPLHFDVTHTAKSEFGRPAINLPAPDFIGDMLCPETDVPGKRDPASTPGAGIVGVWHPGKSHKSACRVHTIRSFLSAGEGHSVAVALRDRLV